LASLPIGVYFALLLQKEATR